MNTPQNNFSDNDPPPITARFACVMSVDDDPVDQLMYHRTISRTDIAQQHLQFTEPLKALAHLTDPTLPAVDLILLDVNMPRMTGFEFLNAAELALGAIPMPPVVLMRGVALTLAHQRQAAGCGAIIAQLDKPLNQDALTDALRELPSLPSDQQSRQIGNAL